MGRVRACGAVAAVVLLAVTGCSADDAPLAAPPSSQLPVAPEVSEPAELPPLPPLPPDPEQEQEQPAQPEPKEPKEPPPEQEPARRPAGPQACGQVTAASGARLQVLLDDGQTSCAQADRVVRAFHRAIAGQQPAGSRRPAKATVDGWSCVSGPPSGQGGTSCSRGTATVSAAVIDAE